MKRKTKKRKQKKKDDIKKYVLNPLILTLILVYILIIFLYFLDVPQKVMQEQKIKYDGEKILKSVIYPEKTLVKHSRQISTGFAFVDNDVVNIEKLRDFARVNYDDIKSSLDIKTDFCIHFEDEDGNLVDISPITGKKGIGVGSSEVKFNIVDELGSVVEIVECST